MDNLGNRKYNSTNMPRILNTVVAGHLCLDIIPNLDGFSPGQFFHHLEPGKLLNVGPALFSTGGPVSNTGLALHILGIPTSLMGKVGQDTFGEAVLALVNRFGKQLTGGMVIDSSTSTSYTIILNPPGIDRIFLHHTGANDSFGPDDIRLHDLNDAVLFHFGYPPLMRRMYEGEGIELVEIFRRARSTGVTTSLDMSLPDPASPSGKAPWRKILHDVLPYVDIFTPSIEELLVTLEPEIYQDLCHQAGSGQIQHLVSPNLLSKISREVIALGVKIILIKIGDRGAYLRTSNAVSFANMGRARPENTNSWSNVELWAPCYQVEVVGTTGSGDSTIAGFLSGFLRGLSAIESLKAAVAVGACNVEAADAIGGLRSWQETLERISSGWVQHRLEINTPGWEWDNTGQLWHGPGQMM